MVFHDAITMEEMCDTYDAFILDQFGVLHDGNTSSPGALNCIHELAARGKKMIILSNTSRRASHVLERLSTTYGFPAKDFIGAITSGEEAHGYLKEHPIGTKCTWITRKDGSVQYVQDDLGLRLVDIEEAEFILVHGTESVFTSASEKLDLDFLQSGKMHSSLKAILTRGIARGLPLVCCNPDYITHAPDGSVHHMPGKLQDWYAKKGGETISFGKPHAEHFHTCVEALDLSEGERVAHVGDSLLHDVAGATASGVDSIFVANGVHAEALNICAKDGREAELDTELLDDLFEEVGEKPTYTVPCFAWSVDAIPTA